MKALLEKLKKHRDEIIKQCEKRDQTSLKRSDDWHLSKNGKAYETKTGTLADAVEGLNEAITQVEQYLAL